jgi:hypothetical protein
MKKLLILCLAFISFSCDKQDYFLQENAKPEIYFSKDNINFSTEIYDTVKLNQMLFYYYRADDLNGHDFYLDFFAGFLSGGFLSDRDHEFMVKSIDLYNHDVSILATDIYGARSEALLHLTVYENLPPVPILSLSLLANLDPYEVQFDASVSFDADAKFGGLVVSYEYTINDDYVINTPLPVIKYIFQSPGQKSIKLRVMDNDQEWSNYTVQYIVL